MMDLGIARLGREPTTNDDGAILAVVETPRGSRSKYDYDPARHALRLKKVLPIGMAFPFDFGFIPQTKAGDGDPLDIVVLTDEATPAGCIVDVRVIGAIELEQREAGQDWTRNDRIFGVALASHAYAEIGALSDLPARMLDEIEAFFTQYNRLEGRELRIIGRAAPDAASKLIAQATV